MPAGELDAVITLLPWVWAPELTHVIEEDREYVASEMSAFLLAWLCELQCTVIDRPSALSLTGCGRWPGDWAAVATRIGADADTEWRGATIDVTVVGGRAVEDGTALLWRRAAEAVAAAAGRSLVTLQFAAGEADPVLVGALPRANVGSPAVADALLSWLGVA